MRNEVLYFGLFSSTLLVKSLQVFQQLCIESGHDLTLGFEWIDGKFIENL